MARFGLKMDDVSLAVIGLGYVGLPLAVAFGNRFDTIGFDTKTARIEELLAGHDSTQEVDDVALAQCRSLKLTHCVGDLRDANVYVVTVPTPIDPSKRPDLTPLRLASSTIGQCLKPGDVVIFESTVYPGASEEICAPVLEKESGLKLNEDFFLGYSPERINPGDKTHRLEDIVKVTSGSTPEAADFIDSLYGQIISAGTHKASSIRVAEAAKVIENTQRDLNIALVNELALIFEKLDLDTEEVLRAAGTKWNFLSFKPGLVGGHCIGVDPYYLTSKAEAVGYHPEIILAGRRINDAMGEHIADRLVKLMVRQGINVVGSKVLVLGLAFKENCPDIRNTKVIDLIRALESYNIQVDVHDPWVSDDDALTEYGRTVCRRPESIAYDAAILAVAHEQFVSLGSKGIKAFLKEDNVLFDVKHVLPKDQVTARL